jgi:prepilin-type processing-associated H-X9-DG protein
LINNNKGAVGANTCPYTYTNCGPNDEPFSLHTGGCHALMCDGAVKFVSENADVQVIRAIAGANEGAVVGDF